MDEQIIDGIKHLIDLFDTAREKESCREPLGLWLSVMNRIDSLRRTQELTEGQELARSYVAACEFMFQCWATLGFRSSFRLAQTLLERAALEMSAAGDAEPATSTRSLGPAGLR